MDSAQLKAAGFNDQEIAEYQGLQSAGFSEQEIEQHYAGTTAPKKRSLLEHLGTALKNIPGDAWQMVQGPWVSSEADLKAKAEELRNPKPMEALRSNPLVGAVKNPLGVPGRMAEFAEEHPAQLLMGFTPLLRGPMLGALGGFAKSNLPERVYGSTVPLLKSEVRNFGPERSAERLQAAREVGVTNRIKKGDLESAIKAKKLTSEAYEPIQAIIDNATARGDAGVPVKDLVESALKDVYKGANASGEPLSEKVVERFKQGFINMHGEQVSVEKAQAIKQRLADETNWDAKSPTGVRGMNVSMARSAIRHAIETELENRYVGLKELNAEYGARKRLSDAINASLPEGASMEFINSGRLSTQFFNRVMTKVREPLAFALDKAREVAKVATRPPDSTLIFPSTLVPGNRLAGQQGGRNLLPEAVEMNRPADFNMRGPMQPQRTLPAGPATPLAIPAEGSPSNPNWLLKTPGRVVREQPWTAGRQTNPDVFTLGPGGTVVPKYVKDPFGFKTPEAARPLRPGEISGRGLEADIQRAMEEESRGARKGRIIEGN